MAATENIFVSVRPALSADAPYLRATCWPQRSLESISGLLQRTEKLTLYRRGLGVVAEREGIACGFGMLTLWPRTAEISDLIVGAAYRGQGIGSQIVNYLTEAARSLPTAVVEIGVALSNPRALKLYRRLGFDDHHTVKIDLGNGPETVLYLYKYLS
jgi:ribosomal protein S18 acetylase RimI-like enzyme